MTTQILKIICDTYLKAYPLLLEELSEQKKYFIRAETSLEITSYLEEGEHYKIVLKMPISGSDTWFVFKKHVEFANRRVTADLISPTSSPPAPTPSPPVTARPPHSNPTSIQFSQPASPDREANFSAIGEELKKLSPGKALFDAPHQMKVGVSDRISVRIAKAVTQVFFEGLSHRLEAEVENIRISQFMSASLRSDDFKIQALSHEEQIIEDNDYTQWDWNVVPLKSGNRKLWVIITILLKAENEQARKTLPVLEKEISVKINPVYSTKTFVSQYWQWLIASAIIPIMGLLLSKK